jgi:hypothetical protein
MSRHDLIARAQARAEARPVPEEWGAFIEHVAGETFVGRWRGETVDADRENRRIFLLWDEDGEERFSRSYAALEREIDRVRPVLGCTIAIHRGDDYTTKSGTTGYAFGVETEPSDEPLPGEPPNPDDGIPF